jgi:glucose-1-phosphate thymidylyltransferase
MPEWRRVRAGLPARKGILLAAGAGTRLHPMTIHTSKQLLPVYDKPLIYYPLSVLMLAGIRDVLIIITERDLPAFRHLLGDGSQWGMAFSYAVQDRPNGLPEAYLLGEAFLEGGASMMILGDNLLYGARLSEELRSTGMATDGATAFAYRVKNPEQFGVVRLDPEDRPVELLEKPSPAPSPWAVIGLYLLDGEAPARARALRPSPRGELEIVDLLKTYLHEGRLRVELLGRGVSWLDTGTPRALLQAAHFVEVLQERQGLQVACPEEIAFRMGYIDDASLERLADPLRKTAYGEYLLGLLAENGRTHA